METIYLAYFLIFALGSVFGSFLNLVSDRVVSSEKIGFSRSKCDHCGKVLGYKNLFPLISFIFQKGHSACCKKQLSFYYPFSELLTGAAFLFSASYSKVIVAYSIVNVLTFIYLSTALAFFIILLLADMKYHLIPDKIVYPAIITVFLFILFLTAVDSKIYYDSLLSDSLGKYLIQAGFFKNHLILIIKRLGFMLASASLISVFFLSLILITKGRGMGGGDVKLGFLIGLFNGFPHNILAVFLGFLLGSLYSGFMILLSKKSLKDTIAFGPFLILGSIISFIWGQEIIFWYLNLF